MKYRKVLYPLILGAVSLQYCVSVPVRSIPRSAEKGMGMSAATWTGRYRVRYSTCYGNVEERHVYRTRQADFSFRPGDHTDIHFLYTLTRDSIEAIEPESLFYNSVTEYAIYGMAVSPYLEKALSDQLRVYLQLHWMFLYSSSLVRDQFLSTEGNGNFGFGMDWEIGMSYGENPEYSFGMGAWRPLVFSFMYRVPPDRTLTLSAHLGYWNEGGPFAAVGVAWTPPSKGK